MYETVVVPTDGSEHAERAAEHGAYLAREFGAEVSLLNVVDVQGAAGVFDAGGVDEEFVGRLEEAGEDAIERIESVVGDLDGVHADLVQGRPAETILDYAEEHDADLLSMGTHGRKGLSRYALGSVTEGVIRHGEVPVMTARATEASTLDDGYDDVVVPTDGSERSYAAVDDALAVAERVDARVHAINVVDVAEVTTLSGYARSELIDKRQETGEEAVEVIADRARDRGLEAVTAVRRGYPSATLLDYVDEEGANLITMATAGRSGLDRFLLGSTTERVIRQSDVPVIAVKA